MPDDQLATDLIAFIRREFLDGDPDGELTTETPLLAWGILDSFKTTRLLAHLEDRLGAAIAPADIHAGNFRDVASIVAMVRPAEVAGDRDDVQSA